MELPLRHLTRTELWMELHQTQSECSSIYMYMFRTNIMCAENVCWTKNVLDLSADIYIIYNFNNKTEIWLGTSVRCMCNFDRDVN